MGARRLAGLTAAALLVVPTAALAAPAAPDRGFGNDGVVLTGVDADAARMILDSAGRPVAAAQTGPMELGFVRRLPDGAADVVTRVPLAGAGRLAAVVEHPGGYAAGGWVTVSGERRFAIARFSAAGLSTGVTPYSPGEIRGLVTQPDGKIVAAGPSGGGIGVSRYAGTAVDFARVHDVAVTDEEASAVVVEPGGRILVAGTGVVDGERRFLLAALTSAGDLDGGFGSGGFVTLDAGDGVAVVRALERQPDGKLVVAGAHGGSGVVARFLPDGTPDAGFSNDGIARLGIPGAIVEDVALQPDGKIVAVGSAAGDALVARLRPGGAHDPGFGADGVARRALGAAGSDELTGVGLAAGGRIVAGGRVDGAIAFTRLTGGDSSDPAIAMAAESLGDLVTFTITATNPGADPARDVAVNVTPPGDAAATALTTAGGVCAGTACTLGTLPPGVRRRITLLARAKAPGPLTAGARIAGATFDSDPANNSAGATGVATPNRVVRRDRTKPKVALRLKARRIRHVRKSVKLVVRTTEAASVVVRTRAKLSGKSRTFARTKTVRLRRKGAKTVRLTLTRTGKQAVKRSGTRRLALTVTARARDAAGNKRVKTLRKTLRRTRPTSSASTG